MYVEEDDLLERSLAQVHHGNVLEVQGPASLQCTGPTDQRVTTDRRASRIGGDARIPHEHGGSNNTQGLACMDFLPPVLRKLPQCCMAEQVLLAAQSGEVIFTAASAGWRHCGQLSFLSSHLATQSL